MNPAGRSSAITTPFSCEGEKFRDASTRGKTMEIRGGTGQWERFLLGAVPISGLFMVAMLLSRGINDFLFSYQRIYSVVRSFQVGKLLFL